MIQQGFRFALRVKPARERVLRGWVGCRRFVWNEALAFQRAQLAAGRKRPGYAALCARLPGLKSEHPWLAEPPAQALQQALKDLCAAWERKYKSRFGAPRFKKRGDGESLRLPQDCMYLEAAGAIKVPKLGVLALRHSRPVLGTVKNVTLGFDGRRWCAALQTERPLLEPESPAPPAEIGLDFGAVKQPEGEVVAMVCSDGARVALPARLTRYERRMRRLQQAVSRKRRGSNNRKKAVARLAACHQRIAAIRADALHQATTAIVREHALVALEDLAVKAMTASAAGTVEAPGKSVRQKAGLNRVILRSGWGRARQMLEYKARWQGRVLVPVPPAHTSQRCAACGYIAAENRPSQARFACVACGHTDHADVNAARNILRRAKDMLAAIAEPSAAGQPPCTAGHAGHQACGADARSTERTRRPPPAAQGGAVGPPLAETTPELEPSGNLHP